MGETRRRALKIVIQITCQFLWLAGLVVGLSGMYLLLNYRHNGLFFAHTYIILPACLALASATLLLASGGLGIWVSLRKSALLQGVFVYLLVMVFCLEATAAALAYVNAGKFPVFIKNGPPPNGHSANLWESLESTWASIPVEHFRHLVESMSRGMEAVLRAKVDSELAPFSSVFQRYTGSSQDPYSDAVDATQKEGCQVKLEEALLFVLHLIIWSSLAVALVETVGFVSVAQLMRDQPLLKYGILDREWA